jgi:dihydrodipicolinate synthase/N-acetylneuraminate lyase
MSKPLQGYFPIMPTPYTRDRQVDLASVRRLVDYLIVNGVQGMAPNGGDSEGRYLTTEERIRITEIVLETNAGRAPVLVGTSAPTTEEAVLLTRHAQRAGADAVFVMPPSNWKGEINKETAQEEMLAHYQAVCEGSDIPIMIHAVASMDTPFLQTLLERYPRIQYIKEETTFGPKLRKYVQALGQRVRIFGPGAHYPAELEWGAMGVMPSCCAPHTHARIFELWQQGQHDKARQEWNRILPLVFWRWHTAAQEAGKVYLMHMGVFETAFTRPNLATLKLEEADRQEMLRVLATLGEPPY